MANGDTMRLAVLIDADNASASVAKELLEEVAKYGLATVKRAFGEPFIAACDRFIFFEVLKKPAEAAIPVQVPDVPDLKELLTHSIRETVRDSGWSRLSNVGALISKTHSSFDARNYGYKKLSELVRGQPYLDVVDAPDGTGFVHVEVRLK